MCHVYIQYPLFSVQFQIFSALMPMNIYCNKEKLVVEYIRIKWQKNPLYYEVPLKGQL